MGMEKAPWIRKRRGEFEKFDNNEWKVIAEDDVCTLPKLSSQLWLTIYNLVMDPQCRQRYEMKSHRKDNLLRLRRFLNEIVFDQIPPLVELLRTLEELSITGHYTQMQTSNLPGQRPDPKDTISSAFFVELVAEVRETLLQMYRGRWARIAAQQKEEIFTKETEAELKRLPDMMCLPRLEGEDYEALEANVGDNDNVGKRKGSNSKDNWINEIARDIGIEPSGSTSTTSWSSSSTSTTSAESVPSTSTTSAESSSSTKAESSTTSSSTSTTAMTSSSSSTSSSASSTNKKKSVKKTDYDKENLLPERDVKNRINFDTPAMRELYEKVHPGSKDSPNSHAQAAGSYVGGGNDIDDMD